MKSTAYGVKKNPLSNAQANANAIGAGRGLTIASAEKYLTSVV